MLPGRTFSFWKWLWANMCVVMNLVNNEWRAGYDNKLTFLLVTHADESHGSIYYCYYYYFALGINDHEGFGKI